MLKKTTAWLLMPNKNYQKGYRLEVRLKKYFQKKHPEAIVVRIGGSKFPDLWVIFPDKASIAVESKWNKYLDRTEKMLARAIVNKGFKFIVGYNDNRKLKFWDGNIMDKKEITQPKVGCPERTKHE